jgi:hypothetical protein
MQNNMLSRFWNALEKMRSTYVAHLPVISSQTKFYFNRQNPSIVREIALHPADCFVTRAFAVNQT